MNEDRDGLDTARLETYLTEHLDEPITDTEELAVGLNRVIRVASADDPQAYVVRVPEKGRDEEGFVDATTEHLILDQLERTDVPAPEAVHLCEDESVIGRPFLVSEFVDGTEIPWDGSLPEGYRDESSREQLGRRYIETLGELHSVSTDLFEDVCEDVDPGTQVERNVAQLDTATRSTGHKPTILWRVADWLLDNAPDRSANALVHGDYKPDNIFLTWADGPQVSAVLDWETAMLRDPRTELGYFLFYWRESDDPAPALEDLEVRHPEGILTDVFEREKRGFWPFTRRAGSPSRRDLVEQWETATGLVYDQDRFYRAFGAFMLATVWEGLYADALERGDDVAGWEAHIEYVARLADAVISGDMPL